MNRIKLLAVIVMIIVSSCTKNSEPTSPDNQKLNLYKESDSAIVSLKYNKKIVVNDEFVIQFTKLISDSRCPAGADCVWTGDGAVELKLVQGDSQKEIILHTNTEPKFYDYAGYRIILETLNPFPQLDEVVNPEDYTAELIIKYSDSPEIKPINIIDSNNDSSVKQDVLIVNGVLLEKDFLKFNLSYPGGCQKHEINLYSYKEILKSNPAQVTVIISHDANKDNCEALITKDVKFDLTEMKNYLKNTYNIRDKVILLLFDPSGKPLRNSVVEYNF